MKNTGTPRDASPRHNGPAPRGIATHGIPAHLLSDGLVQAVKPKGYSTWRKSTGPKRRATGKPPTSPYVRLSV